MASVTAAVKYLSIITINPAASALDCGSGPLSHSVNKQTNTIMSGPAYKKTSDTSAKSSNMWILALVALVTGLITEPLWQMYIATTKHSPSPVLQTPSQSSDRQLHMEDEPTDSIDADETETASSNFTPQYICGSDELNDFLHDFDVPGMHVICVSNHNLTMYKNSFRNHVIMDPLPGEDEDEDITWIDIRSLLQDKLDLPTKNELKQAWALFSPTGERLQLGEESPAESSTNDLFSLGMFLLMEGGQWVWPGVRKGFVRHIQLDETRNATLETLSVQPLVFSVDGFLADEECDWIRVTAEPHMAQSGVSLMDRDKGKPATEWRTSETTFLSEKTEEIAEIDQRTSQLVRIPKNHQEPPQVLRYVLNARYDQHTDYFNPDLYRNDKRTMRMIANGRKNRMATVLWYLSDVAQGGETTFPQMDNGPPVSNQEACKVGLQVKPEKGKVIIFYSLNPDGSFDPLSVHGACPVLDGVKWAANKWVWNEPWSF
jgi:prolyl 4-hydroxylase